MENLRNKLREFANERDWNQFHSPKNLSMALSVEVSELMEHFQWMTEDESRDPDPSRREAIKEEIADVLLYLVRLSDQLGIDPVKAAEEKMIKNARKYPVEKSRGSSRKYTEI